jgi:hypothetical protein
VEDKSDGEQNQRDDEDATPSSEEPALSSYEAAPVEILTQKSWNLTTGLQF